MTAAIGTMENPCTSKNSTVEQRGHAYCKCDVCERVARCTPQFDFYMQVDGSLKCQQCLVDGLRSAGIVTTGFGPDRGRS